ncbi:hypothetical protein GQ473_05490 [archaeon]|nr:hypothetical protein [archaeon]
MPESTVPYKRGWGTGTGRGQQGTVDCSYCGRKVPRYKTFIKYSGFRITDPVLRKELENQHVSGSSNKMYACPACARSRGIVQRRDSTGQRQFGPKKRNNSR